jgi:hypothetical protein
MPVLLSAQGLFVESNKRVWKESDYDINNQR